MTRDEMTVKRYGEGFTYDRLSAFGKRAVDRALNSPIYAATLASHPEDVEARQVTAQLNQRNTFLEQENEDLWEQLNEARAELEELRSKFNPPLSL